MISDSTALMTTLDLAVIGACIWMGLSVYKVSQGHLPDVRGARLIFLGIALVGVFHLLDMVAMLALPQFVGSPRAIAVMQALHLDVRWFVTLVTLTLILLGYRAQLAQIARSNRALASQRQKQADLIDRLPVPAALLDREGRVTRINVLGANLEGARETNVIVGKYVWDMPGIKDEHRRLMQDAVKRTAQGENVRVDLVDCLVGLEPEPAVLDVSFSPIRDQSGEIVELIGTATDITTAWQALQESAKAEERFRSLLQHTRDCIFCYEYDPPIDTTLPAAQQLERLYDGVLVECNQHFADRHQLTSPADALGKTLRAFAAQMGTGVETVFERFITDGYTVSDLEFASHSPDGTVRYFANNGYGVVEDGGLIRRWGSFRDITDRVLAENELRTALAQIQQLKTQLEQENFELRQEVRDAHGFSDIIGDDPKLTRCLDLVAKVAPTDAAVLILGETGTGKELLARAIHERSRRDAQPLVKVNCAALPAELIESEIFGHEKGAFTGAHSRRAGRFELAHGGTLFLDEIGDLPFELQGKLLRVLQEGEFERLGGSETLHVDVRIVAATNKDLQSEVDKGAFRADLFYRINTFPILLPPLRERRDDIALLVQHFVAKHAERFDRRIESIAARTLRYLRNHTWPGNVRELEGFVERALIAATGPVLNYIDDETSAAAPPPVSAEPKQPMNLRKLERVQIESALADADWVIEGRNGAAARLGIAPSTLRSKMKRFNIERPHTPSSAAGDWGAARE